MSRKELERASLLRQVLAKKLTQVQAAKPVGLSERQVRNLVRNYEKYGPETLVSKKRGKPAVMRRYAVQDYARQLVFLHLSTWEPKTHFSATTNINLPTVFKFFYQFLNLTFG